MDHSERPHLSITLPRNFQFHYQENPPRTPEPEPQVEDLQPPPPPRATLKVRRRRTTAVNANRALNETVNAQVVPTIEAPELSSEVSVELPTLQPSFDNGYLSPAVSFSRMTSPPKTPISQMRGVTTFETAQHWSDMDLTNQSETSSRPASSSGFSDSSISSRGSIESFPSLGGSCTSPEDEMTDPFAFLSPDTKYLATSPLSSQQRRCPLPPAPQKFKVRITFTEEMDRHLWMTYMTYLQDPTVTPFKALPSIVPPNGVCHRVARMARNTWKGPRNAFPVKRAVSRYASRSGTPDTIRPPKSGSSTPVPGSSKPKRAYPSEKQCRKRLRELAKMKPSLSAHYQRLLHRSPSPFQSSPEEPVATSQPQGLSSPFVAEASSFSTRDMNVSLATSTAPSMQFGNALSQLTSNNAPRTANHERGNIRSSAHQKSQSLHIGLGLGLGNMLGSSFARMSEMTDSSISQHNAQTWHATSGSTAPLGSPFQLHAPRPRPFKRRALHNLEEQAARNRGDSFVDKLFGAPAESSHRRVRSRGFSLGDMMEGARRLPLSASGPPEFNPFANPPDFVNGLPESAVPAHVLQGQAIPRLASPFGARPNNTFPRASTSHGFEVPASFEERFAGLPSDPAQLNRC